MVRERFQSAPRAAASMAAFLLLTSSGGKAGANAPANVDSSPINMTAQDETSVVWATNSREAGGLYRWENGHWSLAKVEMPPGGVPVGIWQGLDGGVVVLWSAAPSLAQLAWYRGGQYKLLGGLEEPVRRAQVFGVPPGNVWMMADSPNIYRLAQDGRMRVATTIKPDQFLTYRHGPAPATIYSELDATADGQGRTWFWANSAGRFSDVATLAGFLIYDGRSFEYRPSVAGLEHRWLSFLGRADGKHLWTAAIDDGLYSIDTLAMTATRVPEPEPSAFARVTKVFGLGEDTYVVTDPPTRVVKETAEHRLSGVLWRLRHGEWRKVLAGIDDFREPWRDLNRPWLLTREGLWLGSHAAGLWFIPREGDAPQLIGWKQGFPLESVDRLYRLGDGRLLAVDLESSRAVGLEPKAALQPTSVSGQVQVLNPYSNLEPDQRFHLWGILRLDPPALDEWDGEKWIAHPRPGNISPSWLSGVDVDSQGRIWLFPDYRVGPMAIFDPRGGHWTAYPSYQAALEAQPAPLRFLHPEEDRMKPVYGANRQMAYMGAGGGINYFDGSAWRLWNPGTLPTIAGYLFDAPAFFDAAGHLSVNIHHETWELGPDSGWHVIPYEPDQGRLVNWFVPGPPAAVPAGCKASPSTTSFARDRLGRQWWTWQGGVFEGIPGACRPPRPSQWA